MVTKVGVLGTEEFSTVVVKSEIVDHTKLSFLTKMAARFGLRNVAFCSRHNLYHFDDESKLDVLYLCPLCWEEQKHLFKEVYE